jgi:hypothetical protein
MESGGKTSRNAGSAIDSNKKPGSNEMSLDPGFNQTGQFKNILSNSTPFRSRPRDVEPFRRNQFRVPKEQG